MASKASESQLVVIGASAGGIEALSRVVASLPADFPAPIVIAQHLDPRRPSHLADILARHSKLPVKIAGANTRLTEGVVFVVPSNRLVEVVDHRLRLRPAKPGAVAPSVDLLLTSAASAYGPRLIAVILTGTGTDGSAGAWQVKEAGGSVVIENPETAMFPSMPGSISPSLVDARADLDSIGQVVGDLLAAGENPPEGSEGDDYARLLDRIRERSGVDFSTYKSPTIVRRLRGRMRATGRSSLAEYAAQLERDPDEYAKLVSSLLIKVTEFFRDPKVFAHLRDRILPDLINDARRNGRELRIWSAGCSSGEEAYSLAITVAEAMGERSDRVDVRIFATDVDAAAIGFARRGVYPPSTLANVPEAVRERYFVKSDGGYTVIKRLRAQVIFGEHDLSARVPFPRIDLLLCRNVLIYFTPPMQHVALETFAFSLRPDGHLVLGLSETVAALPEPYAEDHGGFHTYRRLAGQPTVPHAWPKVHRVPRDGGPPLNRAIQATRLDIQAIADRSGPAEGLLLHLGVGLVLVDARYDIVRINTAARRLLGIHGTAFDQDFIHLAEALPSTAVRTSIDAALTGKTSSAVYEVTSVDVSRDEARFLETVVRPYRGEGNAIEAAAIELTDVTEIERDRRLQSRTRERLTKAAAVNQRLLRANEELTALVAELRLSNKAMLRSSEQAQAGREEVETLNEEFQATNEELETLNEELTASVEELRIANEDLGARTEELRLQAIAMAAQEQATEEEHDRLRSILASLGDAVVAVDREGRNVATNPAYDRLFVRTGTSRSARGEVRPEDVAGVPLAADAWPQQRAARGERFRMEFAISDADGHRRFYEAVAEPLTTEDRTWGGVVTFRDLSERTMRLSLERLMAAAGHELKTPTAAIHNYLQLVERRLESGDAVDAVTYAERASIQTRRLGDLVDRLFDVSRIQSGRLELLLEPVDIVSLVREATDVAGVLPGAPSIRFSAAAKSLEVHGDAGRLQQVFLNLLANAIDHARGSASIDVSVRRARGYAIVDVTDHGKGVSADDLATMFDAYARTGQSRRPAGLGLGLFVSREIATAHGGEILATSRVGEGTTMTVRLPIGPIPATASTSRPAKPRTRRAAAPGEGRA